MNFNELCIGCRTYRRFQPKEIDANILDELMENVRIANSAMNAQVPVSYTHLRAHET